ncbi:tetratricopeptide repeat protein [Virgibacillus sp. DJP39]|uniref:tetratricopeptide repeat protein n=1 Tax=Virgibacillus sp. DJP39 TaxID=3409790 RepID=UPI003BB65DDA
MPEVKSKQSKEKYDNVVPFIPDADFYFVKGTESFQKRKFDVAVKWMKKAIEYAPKNPLYHCQLSIVYTEIGAYHAANQLLTKVLQSSGDKYADCYYLLANNYAHLGLLNDAKKYAESYLTHEPDGDFYEEAHSLLEMLDFDDTEDDDNEWELEEEDELLIYQETIFNHMESLEWNKALPILEEMLVLFPEHKMIKHDYTQVLFKNGYEEDAITMELEMLMEDPNNLLSHMNLATFYFERENVEYKDHIQVLLNVYSIHEQQKLKIATTLARTNYYQDAYNRFKLLSKGKLKGHSSYYRWYSIAAFYIGNTAKAESLWDEGCGRHPLMKKETRPFN